MLSLPVLEIIGDTGMDDLTTLLEMVLVGVTWYLSQLIQTRSLCRIKHLCPAMLHWKERSVNTLLHLPINRNVRLESRCLHDIHCHKRGHA